MCPHKFLADPALSHSRHCALLRVSEELCENARALARALLRGHTMPLDGASSITANATRVFETRVGVLGSFLTLLQKRGEIEAQKQRQHIHLLTAITIAGSRTRRSQ